MANPPFRIPETVIDYDTLRAFLHKEQCGKGVWFLIKMLSATQEELKEVITENKRQATQIEENTRRIGVLTKRLTATTSKMNRHLGKDLLGEHP